MKNPPVFVYGTLSHPTIVQILLGRSLDSTVAFPKAHLGGFSRHPIRNQVFPAMIPAASSCSVDGFLLEDLTDLDLTLLDWFEADEYDRNMVKVQKEKTLDWVEAEAYIWKNNYVSSVLVEEEWSYENFCQNHLEWYLQSTVRPCRQEMERLGLTKSS
mmetsp:Transcript_5342/g.7698  ORF Transcript_5342/g.7698 Transcript_5342/m.7698 type:complete len:158 (+) Transcript_5342:51-524(+)